MASGQRGFCHRHSAWARNLPKSAALVTSSVLSGSHVRLSRLGLDPSGHDGERPERNERVVVRAYSLGSETERRTAPRMSTREGGREEAK